MVGSEGRMIAFRLSTYLSELAPRSAWYEKDEGFPSAERGLRGLNAIADLEAKQCPVQCSHICLALGGLASPYIYFQGLAACSASLWECRVLGMCCL